MKLFVYGTLKRGDCRSHLLADATYLGEAVTDPRYKLYTHGPYPALIDAERVGLPGVPIQGELYAVDAATLARLDEEEGLDEGLYERRPISLADPDGSAEAYFYLRSIADMTDCGERWIVGRGPEQTDRW